MLMHRFPLRLWRSRSAAFFALTSLLLMLCAFPARALAEGTELASRVDARSLSGDEQWSVSTSHAEVIATAHDELAGHDVIHVTDGWVEFRSRQAVKPPYTVEAAVRFPTGKSNNMLRELGVLRVGVEPVEEKGIDAAYSLMFHAPPRGEAETNKGAGLVGLRDERTTELGNNGRSFSTRHGQDAKTLMLRPRFPADAISPIWPVDFRQAVVRDMSRIPLTKNQWRRVRIDVARDGSARLWHNGFLVADYAQPADAAGHVSLRLYGPLFLDSLRVVREAAADGPFLPVPLDDLVNAAGFVDAASLPASFGEVPFIAPSRNSSGDHVDIGRSVFRYRMHEGFRSHSSPNAAPAPEELDPARIRLRVPNRPISRIWVLAAADGEANSTPVITARFYRHKEGYPLDARAVVPGVTAKSDESSAQRIAVTMNDGRAGSLWVVPIEVDTLRLNTEFQSEEIYELELTKQIEDFRAFPDPTVYATHPAGLPSAVRLYGLTLETSPLAALSSGDVVGNIYAEEEVRWLVDLTNTAERPLDLNVELAVTGPYGKLNKTYRQHARVAAGKSEQLTYRPEVEAYGLYTVRTTIKGKGVAQQDTGHFILLPPDKRKADGRSSRWGIYYWGGGHDTHDNQLRNMEILHKIGARTGAGQGTAENLAARQKYNIGPRAALLVRRVPDWARAETIDPQARRAWQDELVAKLKEDLELIPDLEYVSLFAESSVSLRLTHGMPPEGNGRPYHQDLTDDERARMRVFYETATAAIEATRKEFPHIKINFGHASPLFAYPLFKYAGQFGFDMKQFNSYGVDSPQFERMPERPPRATEPSLMYFQKQMLREAGIGLDDVDLVHVESFFPPSHRLGLGRQQQADHIVRTAVHGFAWGTDKYLSALASLYVPADYWGTSHYGSAGLIGPGPRFDPSLPVAAYATMTQMLDLFQYDGYLETGSRGSYALRFEKDNGDHVYCCYTLRGERPLRLIADAEAKLTLTDVHGNTQVLQQNDRRVEVTITPQPVWVTATGGAVTEAEAGSPAHSAAPGPHFKVLEDFENQAWKSTGEADPNYAENHWDVERELAPMTAELVRRQGRQSQAMRVTMDEVSADKLLRRRYGVFVPKKPIAIPGKARGLGIWANGNSGWKRVIYEIEDAEGEIYQNVGTQDAWNCDDIHSWSHTNFDGWRFMEFPLPGNSAGDNYRQKDSVWWGHSGGDEDGVVDLPVRLNKIIVEMATHQIYVDQMVPVKTHSLELDDLTVVYDDPNMMTNAPVAQQRAAAKAYNVEDADTSWLPNPLARLQNESGQAAPKITALYPPEERRDGTTLYVEVAPVENARSYRVYVSAEADGRGAMSMGRARSVPHAIEIRGLQPRIPMYFFATYIDENGKESKPSPVRKTILADEFPMK